MRKLRKIQELAVYHVTARAVHRRTLLDPRPVKEMFLKVLARAKLKFNFKIENFVLMGNHFHFIIRPGMGENLSNIMKWILQTFAIRYNKIHGLWGHFWGGRFSSSIIPSFREFIRIFEYIDNNPVNAGLVKDSIDWPWGGSAFRRSGQTGIIEELSAWLRVLFPGHLPDSNL